jgi:hypothetical protein
MSQELENHRDLRPFLLLYNPILFQNDNNPPELFLIKKNIQFNILFKSHLSITGHNTLIKQS